MRDKNDRTGDMMTCCLCNGMMGVVEDHDGPRWVCQCGRSVPVVTDEDQSGYEDWSTSDRRQS